MGPRFINRGEGGHRFMVCSGQYASMGPRFINRGEWLRMHFLSPMHCFNGAAVYKPRRESGPTRAGAESVSFNGAAVYKPRRAPVLTRRSESRPCFNGAAVYKPRRGRCRMSTRHRLTSFNGAAVYKPRRGKESSSGLPYRRCFNGAAVYKPRRAHIPCPCLFYFAGASMGPRFINRGETVQAMDRSQQVLLQWGRGL